MKNWEGYKQAIEENLTIVDKDKNEVPFILNPPQIHFLQQATDRNVILKARKMGFSSVLLAIAVIKFIFGENEKCVSMSFDQSASAKQLERAKHFIKSYERKNGISMNLKYNSKNEMVWEGMTKDGSHFTNALRIGTAKSSAFGRGDDITFLHLTEVSSADKLEYLLAGVGEALVRNAMLTMETTANGYNEFKTFWDEAAGGHRGYTALFYDPSWEYDETYLNQKKLELGRLYDQEYPSTPELAFIATGDNYFDKLAIQNYLNQVKDRPDKEGMWRKYRPYQRGEFILCFADTAAGGGDFCAAQFLSKDNLDIPTVYHSKSIATEMTPRLHEELERIYQQTGVKPVVCYERNNGGVYELERLNTLNRNQKYTVYRQKRNVGTRISTNDSPKLGWDTNSATRPAMLGMLKEAIDGNLITIIDRPTINEMFSFVEVRTTSGWKAQAESNAHDDLIMSLAGVWQMYQTEDKPRDKNEYRPRRKKFYDSVTGRLLS